jgi:diphthine synthase
MLYLIGTGLYYLTDLPFRALKELKKCKEVYLEHYTNLNDISTIKDIEKIINKKIKILDREDAESEFLLEKARTEKVALLVPGDPLSATTHISLIIDCKQKRIDYKIVHASSIFTAVAESGLSLYKFGAACSIPIYTESFKPDSFFDIIEKNLSVGLHTLVLLEVKGQNEFVGVKSAVELIKKIEREKKLGIIDWKSVIGISKLGSEKQSLFLVDSQKIKEAPPLCIIIPGELNKVEKENMDSLIPKN